MAIKLIPKRKIVPTEDVTELVNIQQMINHIIQGGFSGTLDDIPDGITYGRARNVELENNYVELTTEQASLVNMFPAGDDTSDLGSTGKNWATGYINIVHADNSNILLDTNGITTKGLDLRLQTAGGTNQATIGLDNDGNIINTPKNAGYVYILGNFAFQSGSTIGLILAPSADQTLLWYTNSGTRNHSFRPDTTGYGYIGDDTSEWGEMHSKKGDFSNRLRIPGGADMFDT